MKNKRLLVVFSLITLGYLGLIFFLSSQEGTDTAATSGTLARFVVNLFYAEPTPQQFDSIHMLIRKLAHIGLFFVLGVLVTLSCGFVPRLKLPIAGAVSTAMVVFFSFFDEWRKLSIPGRHFSFNESCLNAVSGVVGVAITIACLCFARRRKQKA